MHSPLLLKFCHSSGKNCWSQFVANRQPINKKAFGMKVLFQCRMLQPSNDRRELQAAEGSFPPLHPDPDWKTIAEELINEKDDVKVRGLSQRLIDALEERQRAS